ncbi:hypothetical protein AA0472_1299 [Acetobacter estunensis NRIC 0472]|nr:hypothetical protein AA0472_1299 [Acetobacter estunensis NRIC 0472]
MLDQLKVSFAEVVEDVVCAVSVDRNVRLPLPLVDVEDVVDGEDGEDVAVPVPVVARVSAALATVALLLV